MWVKLIIDRVPVSPFIRIRNQVVLVRNQNPATLECEVEGFPEPAVHWERSDGRRLKMSDKYRTEVYDRRDNYKVIPRTCIRGFSANSRVLYFAIFLRSPLFTFNERDLHRINLDNKMFLLVCYTLATNQVSYNT